MLIALWGVIIIPILQMNKLRLTEIYWSAQVIQLVSGRSEILTDF